MDNNQELKDIAIKILEKTNIQKDKTYGFASITILMIISIVLTCIRILQECNKNQTQSIQSQSDKYSLYKDQIKTYSFKRGWFTKMRLKKMLRKEMSVEDYNKYSMSIISALLDTGETLTDEEIITLVEAANV